MSDEEIECTFYDEDYVKKLQEENKLLRECVEFYGDPRNYNMDSSFIEEDDQLISYINETQWEVGNITKYPMQDYVGGKKAREILKQIEKQGD